MVFQNFPRSTRYLFGNELAERWSFYGMKGVLVLFLTQFLVDGMGQPDYMSKPEAAAWVHLFIAAAYITPLLGAILADAFFGRYRTILGLSLFYCIGHFVLALDETRTGLLAGGFLIALGAGGIKPNVSSFLGDQVGDASSVIREKVFSWFYIFINGGAILAYLTAEKFLRSEWLGDIGWNVKVTFGLPGVLMLIATFVLWLGQRKGEFRLVAPIGWKAFRTKLFGPDGKKMLLKVAPIYLFGAIFWACFDQSATTWILQAEHGLVKKSIFGIPFGSSELQAFNPFYIMVLTPAFTGLLYPWLRKYIPFNPIQKISAGFILSVLSFLIIALLQERIDAQQTVSISWQAVSYIFLTAAEILISITLLELGYAAAPDGLKSFVMSFYALSIALGNILTAWVNKWMLVSLTVASMTSGGQTLATFAPNTPINDGDLIQVSGLNGLTVCKGGNTVPLMGEFYAREVERKKDTFALANSSGEWVQSTGDYQADHPRYPSQVFGYRLQGAEYFWFFTYLLMGTSILFPALFWKRLLGKNPT